jgi:DeoR family fructose operon transcriptional repressor
MASEITIEERRRKEVELLAVRGFVGMAELVQILDVSDSTIRRDLEVLEEQGLIKRTHGGAVFVKDGPAHKLAFADRQTTAAEEKATIALAVAARIPENQTVALDGGTTCHEIARAIAGRRLSVVTNSVPIASLLSVHPDTEVTLVGGYLYPRTGVALGATAVEQLGRLHATQLVMSCAGVTEEGSFNVNQMMVDVERKMMAIADEVLLAVDHKKFGKRGVVKLCDLDELNVLVTDDGADDDTRRWLGGLAAEVVFAARPGGPWGGPRGPAARPELAGR